MRPIDADELEEIVQAGLRENPHKDGFARVCHRTEYTHFLDVIRRMPTIVPPPNDPLTLEELLEMDGEPVGVVQKEVDGRWALIGVLETKYCGKDWCPYRRKPEECDASG